MKKNMLLLFVLMLTLTITGCTKLAADKIEYEPEFLNGYIIIEDNILYLDEVEIITAEDKARIAELSLDIERDLPDGYYIYNPVTEKVSFELTEDTLYTFTDSNLLFVEDEEGNRLYTTNQKEEFLNHLKASYGDDPPAQKVPFLIKVADGKVISITEEFQFTI